MTTLDVRMGGRDQLEAETIRRHMRRFSWLSTATIAVSFIHMVGAIALYSPEATGLLAVMHMAAAVGMTALTDLASWVVANYLHYAKRRKLTRSGWIKALFAFALVITLGLNFAYLWKYKPAATEIPIWTSALIAGAFGIFIPMCIAVSALARGELEDDLGRKLQTIAEREARHDSPAKAPQQQPIIVTEVQNIPLTSPNEALAAPDPARQLEAPKPAAKPAPPKRQRDEMRTDDLPAILEALQREGIQRFAFASAIGRACGWTSPSSSTKARDYLREAGALRGTADGAMEIVREVADQIIAEARAAEAMEQTNEAIVEPLEQPDQLEPVRVEA